MPTFTSTGERDVERERALHRLAEHRDEAVDLVLRRLEEQLVVDLEEHPGLEALVGEAIGEADHCDLHDVGRGALDRHVDRIRSPAPRSAALAAWSSGIDRFRPSHVVTWPWRRAWSLMWSM